ncbi:MAG: hypothetical protein K6E49_08785 [Lachnospiraceae bacterium]|nr:hypothetical protein [Lachnospiraceae bacterium]
MAEMKKSMPGSRSKWTERHRKRKKLANRCQGAGLGDGMGIGKGRNEKIDAKKSSVGMVKRAGAYR